MTKVAKDNSLNSEHQNLKKSNTKTKIKNSMNCKLFTNQKVKKKADNLSIYQI